MMDRFRDKRVLLPVALALLVLASVPVEAAKGIVKACSGANNGLKKAAHKLGVELDMRPVILLDGRDVTVIGAPLAGLDQVPVTDLAVGVDAALLGIDLPEGKLGAPVAPGFYRLRMRSTDAEILDAFRDTAAGKRPKLGNARFELIDDNDNVVLSAPGNLQWVSSLKPSPDSTPEDVVLDLGLESGRDPIAGSNEQRIIIRIWVGTKTYRVCIVIIIDL